MKYTKLYITWINMLQRCNNKNHPSYHNYGGRGIKVCDEWATYSAFAADMGNCPEGSSLERKDNNLGYNKDNCKWATSVEQASNQRLKKNNKSGVKGVCWKPSINAYQVTLHGNYLGIFYNLFDAVARRKSAENARQQFV